MRLKNIKPQAACAKPLKAAETEIGVLYVLRRPSKRNASHLRTEERGTQDRTYRQPDTARTPLNTKVVIALSGCHICWFQT
jgi:hypothetical protein